MAEYRISGVWKNANGVVTHYAFHQVNQTSVYRATKLSKAEAIRLLANNNYAYTWLWNYKSATWSVGSKVDVVNSFSGSYLRSDRNDNLTDNLAHLINLIGFRLKTIYISTFTASLNIHPHGNIPHIIY